MRSKVRISLFRLGVNMKPENVSWFMFGITVGIALVSAIGLIKQVG